MVAGGIGLFLLAGILIFVVAPLFAQSPADVGDARTSAIQLIAGVVVAVGALFTARTYRLNRTGQITERFTKAIGQLGDDKVEIRLGGIYALEQIAKEPGSNHHPQIMEVLTAYVRERAPALPKQSITEASSAITTEDAQADGTIHCAPETDIQAVMTVLGRRKLEYDNQPLNLVSVDLRGANLIEAHLEDANLGGAHLEGAILRGAYLEGGDLKDAHLEKATLVGAHLERADLAGAHLQGADLKDAELRSANLDGTYLNGAALSEARLKEVILNRAHLNEAILSGAHLEGTNLKRGASRGCNPHGGASGGRVPQTERIWRARPSTERI